MKFRRSGNGKSRGIRELFAARPNRSHFFLFLFRFSKESHFAGESRTRSRICGFDSDLAVEERSKSVSIRESLSLFLCRERDGDDGGERVMKAGHNGINYARGPSVFYYLRRGPLKAMPGNEQRSLKERGPVPREEDHRCTRKDTNSQPKLARAGIKERRWSPLKFIYSSTRP
ncbi:hypothetical protein X777_03686 [Ooceraea biroi]|uniref:Uncharacterized protein n=1 Tax=Ooceraea biroi TaxID=2015173 RepID=A0A026WK22_OOCBI|nr:hypothetical protein X777_03686 [Ooceraea biroi]